MSFKLRDQINQFHGSQIISLDTVTDVRVRGGKKNPYYGKLRKVTKGSLVMIFKSSVGFKNMVNRRLANQIELQGDILAVVNGDQSFTPGPRPWGKRVSDTPFVFHKEKYYLETIFLRPGKTKYYFGSKEVRKEDIKESLFLKVEGKQGDLRNKVIIRTYAMSSIIKVRKAGAELVGEASEPQTA